MKNVSASMVAVVLVIGLSVPMLGSMGAKAREGGFILKETASEPQSDGTIALQEYSLEIKAETGTIALSRNATTLSFGISLPTAGWVAIGFGSSRMDKSYMVMGYVKDGVVVIEEQKGAGYKHSVVTPGALIARGGTEDATTTVIEGKLPFDLVAASDAKTLPVIIAYGKDDSFTTRHVFRTSVTVELK